MDLAISQEVVALHNPSQRERVFRCRFVRNCRCLRERKLTKEIVSKVLLIHCATYRQERRKVYLYLRRSLVSFPSHYVLALRTNKLKDADVCVDKNELRSY